MQIFHFHHHHQKHRAINSNFALFELSVWLHVFSRSMISVFIPIFLLRLGYSLKIVMFYYLILNIFDLPLNFLARYFTRKYGARVVIIIGSLFSVAFFVGLYALKIGNLKLLFFLSFLAAVYDSFYWVAHLYFFLKTSEDNTNVSKNTSSLYIARQMAGIMAPAFGGVVALILGKSVLILISVFILVLSIIPLFWMKNINDKPKRKQKTFQEFFSNTQDFKDYIAVGFYSLHGSAENVIWPVFIYLIFNNLKSVAILPVLVSVATIIFTYFIGRLAKNNRKNLIGLGAGLTAFIWFLRIITDYTIFYYISVFLVGLFAVMVSIPLDSNIFEKGEEKDALSASTYRNCFSMGFKIIFYLALILLSNIFNFSFIVAIFSMLLLLVSNYFFGTRFFNPLTAKIK